MFETQDNEGAYITSPFISMDVNFLFRVFQALVKLLHLIRQDLERERRGIEGVENLARALRQQPTFGAEESQQNVTEKLHHVSLDH